MKKTLLIALAALLTLAGYAQPKFAHVRMQELIQLMPEMDQARATMNASQKEAQDTYQTMVQEFQTKYEKYQQTASTLTGALKEAKEKELTDIQARIQEFEQSIQAELQQQQQTLMAPVAKKAQDAVNELAREGKYIYVFDASSVIYLDDTQSVDLTPAARTKLNIAADRTMEKLQAELQAQAQADAQAQAAPAK